MSSPSNSLRKQSSSRAKRDPAVIIMRTKASVNFVFPMPCVSRFKKIYEREWGKGGVKNIVWSLVGEGGGEVVGF